MEVLKASLFNGGISRKVRRYKTSKPADVVPKAKGNSLQVDDNFCLSKKLDRMIDHFQGNSNLDKAVVYEDRSRQAL